MTFGEHSEGVMPPFLLPSGAHVESRNRVYSKTITACLVGRSRGFVRAGETGGGVVMRVYQSFNPECPVCGASTGWLFGVVRHVVAGVRYTHVRFVNEGWVRVCLLKNGRVVGE